MPGAGAEGQVTEQIEEKPHRRQTAISPSVSKKQSWYMLKLSGFSSS